VVRTLLLLTALLASPPLLAASEAVLQVDGRVRDVRTLDLDGDSAREVLVFSVDGYSRSARKMVSVFWQLPSGSLPRRPDVVWELEESVVALDVAAPDGEQALYSLHHDGIYLQAIRKNRSVSRSPVLRHSFPHLVPSDDTIPLMDFAGPWGAPGASDLLVPALPHPLLFRAGTNSYGAGITLPVLATASYIVPRLQPALNSSYHFPAPSIRESTSGRHQLLFFDRDHVVVCDPHRVFDQDDHPGRGTAATRIYPVDILSEEEALSDRNTVKTRILDLNGDHRPDLVAVVYRETGILELAGRVMVFFSRTDGSFRHRPDQVLQMDDGIYYMTRFQDLDDDGLVEILIPTAKLGIWGYLRVLTSGKIAFTVRTLTLGEDGMYDTEAVRKDPFTIRLSDTFEIPAVVYGDLNGDAVQDIAVGRGGNRMCVHLGARDSEDRSFASRPSQCFKADPYERYVTGRLQGHRDVLMRFSTTGDRRSQVTVTFLEEPANP